MDYKVEIDESKMGLGLPLQEREQSVTVTFDDGKIKRYKYADLDCVYQMIFDKKPIDLTDCYVNNFSVDAYRAKYNIGVTHTSKEDYISIFKFKAPNAFFDATKGVDFSKIIFINEDISFIDACFGKGNIAFRNIDFKINRISFLSAKFFTTAVSFESCNYFNCHFEFAGTIFHKGSCAWFINIRNSKNYFDFKHIKANKCQLRFQDCIFGTGNVNFYSAIIGNLFFKDCVFNSQINFQFVHCQKLEFRNIENNKTIIITTSWEDIFKQIRSDNNINLNSTIGSIFISEFVNYGRIIIDWDRDTVKEIIERQIVAANIAKSFQLLKENFKNIGQYKDEDLAYVEYMNWEIKAQKQNNYKKKFCKRIKSSLKRRLIRFMGCIGGYGTKPGRIAFSMLAVCAVFGLIFTYFGSLIRHDQMPIDSIWDGLYISGLNFLTLGLGNVPTESCIRFLTIGEGFLGLFLMSYFTVAVVRKILR